MNEKKPVIYPKFCDNCIEPRELCWTLEGMSACMVCRERKLGCSHSVKRGDTLAVTPGVLTAGGKPKRKIAERSVRALPPLQPAPTLRAPQPSRARPEPGPVIMMQGVRVPEKPSTISNDTSLHPMTEAGAAIKRIQLAQPNGTRCKLLSRDFSHVKTEQVLDRPSICPSNGTFKYPTSPQPGRESRICFKVICLGA